MEVRVALSHQGWGKKLPEVLWGNCHQAWLPPGELKERLARQSPKNKFELTLPYIHIPHTAAGLAACNEKNGCVAWSGLKWASVYILHITFKTRTSFISQNNLSEREGMSPKVRRMNQGHQDIQDHIAELLHSSSDTQGECLKARHKSALWTTFALAHVRIHPVSLCQLEMST